MRKTMDGNMAAAHVAYAFTEVASIYPITPSSPMAEYTDEWQAAGRKNIWGETVSISEMQSEAGAAGAIHGALKAGALATTYTASQGLLLMLPNMYKIAGELLPSVIHVAARAVSTNALNIFGDQSDVMSARATGYAMLASASVQEVMDLSAVAHLATIDASVPFMSFFDGFRTSHELQKIEVLAYDDLGQLINQDKLQAFRDRAMNPDHPTVSGTNQNADIHFQQRETTNSYYEKVPAIVQKYMGDINKLRGTSYDLVNYHGVSDATEVVVAIGSVGETIEQTIDYLNAQGRKVGFLNIHLYRPFPTENFLEKLPKTAKKIAVLDRTKEPGSDGEPLYLDVKSVLFDQAAELCVIGGRYGIGSKDTTPNQIVAIFDELIKENPKKQFTIGIEDDVTNLSLDSGEPLDLTPDSTFQAKFWGFGSDGTVGANKSAIKIIGNRTDKYVQGAFAYDSKKSGGLTVSHLRFGDTPIQSTYMIQHADFVSLSTASYVHQYDVLKGLKKGGTFLLNTVWTDEQLSHHLPSRVKRYIAENEIAFYTMNAVEIAGKAGLGRRINTAMQVGFFKLSNIMPFDDVFNILKQDAHDSYARKSMKIVEQNWQAMDLAVDGLHQVQVPANWAHAEEPKAIKVDGKGEKVNKYVFQIVNTVNSQEGDKLSVGDLIANNMTDGRMPLGTTAYEKRGVALEVPVWDVDKCTMCNECSFVCPHAAIRPFLLDEDEVNEAPEGYLVKDYRGADGLMYRIQVSVEDCTGCGLCVEACPAKGKALEMKPYEEVRAQAANWAFSMTLKAKANPAKVNTVIGTQFNTPLLEFSGACAGCGETPYVKLLTQMFGDRMMIANATGCSSIWGGAAPVSPYTTNVAGHGPAWSNSLLEDNAEFGYGMWLASQARRDKLAKDLSALLDKAPTDVAALMQDWLNHKDESDGTRQRAEKLKSAIAELGSEFDTIRARQDQFVKPTQWIIGGDGWAYDIGFGGLDHVIASGADVNLLVMDNEVYANTGGQVSKGTPRSAIEKFSAAGKAAAKKDLGFMAMTYGNVYVAQIASGANKMQTIKAFEEAERHNGPSIIIAYTPCISHGLRGGMSRTLQEAKEAVASGYWQLYRYNPELEDRGKNPMQLDFKKPEFDKMTDFMTQQVRFASLKRLKPETAQALFDKTTADARRKFVRYARMSGDLEKFLAKEAKVKGETAVVTEKAVKVERSKREKNPEAEARRAARRAERATKREK
ncbi:pyruvate-flavodoxin oxidoreductase [Lactococcus hodotermopsidis]|uniref:Pyruvate-flavodoxin oxidoreductase n=1 Tax=Pseudolactococcus hodotermopsidis TaxID=2709157 RepID=A0A6A0BBX7_9LACT|nr:pyruvate:ferredoxin (flavodoxin) oxidoreductase [Lactococcus hodotermopsidis]GFH42900.1 pyruvate-flavodoxin oxidoreductase [Lactococcus hodotermopsidis]